MIQQVGERCTGCGLCSEICKSRAIRMEADDKGFLTPKVDDSMCVKCGACSTCCPTLNKNCFATPHHIFVATNKNSETLKSSTSGGIFRELAKHEIFGGGVRNCVLLSSWLCVA